jgi:hypothetical protein
MKKNINELPEELENVETFEEVNALESDTSSPVSSENSKKEVLKKESLVEKEKKIKTIDAQIKEALARKDDGSEAWNNAPIPEASDDIPKEKSWWKKVMVAFGIAGAVTASAHASEGKDLTPKDTLSKKIPLTEKASTKPRAQKKPADSLKSKKVEVYTSSKTKEGGITPTGLSNSFYENKYGITEHDLEVVAETYGFRTESQEALQADLIDYLLENHPDIIEKTLTEYDQPTKGRGIKKELPLQIRAEGLKDGMIGGRIAFMLNELKKKLPPEKKPLTPSKEALPQPEGSYVINIRGDDPKGLGAYYFLKNKNAFEKVKELVSRFSAEKRYADKTRGEITYDMSHAVFLDNYATPELKALLGTAWLRDPNDRKRFVMKSKTASYESGIVKQ